MAAASERIDIVAFERWIETIPDHVDVRQWVLSGVDIWPLFKTTLIGLGILARIKQPKRGMSTGGIGWQAGVLADYFTLSGHRKALPSPVWEGTSLTDSIVYFASGGHGRHLGDFYLTPALDVPAALLEREGHRSIFWYEELAAQDPSLGRTLHGAAYGLADLLADARARAMRFGTRGALSQLPGFLGCCEIAAGHLRLRKGFLLLWLARQLNLVVSVAALFERIFSRSGRPKLLVILNSGVWSSAGLVFAAKRNGIPVIEVHHGAESRSAITAPGQRPHFSLFNTAPDALVSWECHSRGDDRVFSAGPLGLQLATIIPDGVRDHHAQYAQLRQLIDRQRQALASRLRGLTCAGEIVVSLQPGDDGQWIVDILHEITIDLFVWVRMHSLDAQRALPAAPAHLTARIDWQLGSSSLLALLLERADVHLTRFSGVTLEAAAMGVPTIATEEYAADLYGADVPELALQIETSPRAAAARIESIIADRSTKQPSRLPDAAGIVPFAHSVMAAHREGLQATADGSVP